MKVKPVVYYKKPGYPAGADIQSHPELLKKVPDRWAKNSVVLTALGMSLALCACAAPEGAGQGSAGQGGIEPGGAGQNGMNPGGRDRENAGQASASQDSESQSGRDSGGPEEDGGTEGGTEGKGLVAPVFIHGGGTGAYGCVAVTSPFFLSEEEAYEIIKS